MSGLRHAARIGATLALASSGLVLVTPAVAESGPTYDVTAGNGWFVITPEFAAGKGDIAFTNTGTAPHMIGIGEVAPGTTLEDIETDEKALIRTVAWLDAVAPGGTGEGKLHKLRPGSYLYGCFVTTPSGIPHWKFGMRGEFTIS